MQEKKCTKCGSIYPLSKYQNDSRGKLGKTAQCNSCQAKKAAEWRMKNREKSLELMRRSREKHREQRLQDTREWRKNNPEHVAAYDAKYKEENREARNRASKEWRLQNKEKVSLNAKTWRAANREKSRNYPVKRRAMKKQAIPLWHDKADVESIYRTARAMSAGGDEWQVDHIVPLTHSLVCGLHCSSNLRITTKFKNQSKSNTFQVG